MRKHLTCILIFAATWMGATGPGVPGQGRGNANPQLVAQRNETEKTLESIAVIERKLMVPMRDGKRMATDVYRPKDTSKKYPAIFVRTPYNFNYWDIRNGVPGDMNAQLDAVKRGCAYVLMNERGHFFSEGNYDILGPPLSDGSDALSWIARQPWSNLSAVICSGRRKPCFLAAREPSGISPAKYLSVNNPWAKGENAIHPTPSSANTLSSPSSIQRPSIL